MTPFFWSINTLKEPKARHMQRLTHVSVCAKGVSISSMDK